VEERRTGVQDPEVDPAGVMHRMLGGYEMSQMLFALAEADVPTVLDRAGQLSIDDLAERTQTDPDVLGRLIRSLVPHGVFALDDGRVRLTDLGATLSADNPHSLRGIAVGSKNLHYLPYSELGHTLRTGEPAATKYYGMPYFDWITADPRRIALFNDAIGALLTTSRARLIDTCRLPAGDVVADIGGGNGALLDGLLARPENAHRRGIVFDLPGVAATAVSSDRITVVAGDFFDEVPPADIYLLVWILHDWSDPDAHRILTSIASAGKPGARLLIFESVMPDDDAPHPSKPMDITMLALLGGRERTEEEYRILLDGAGFTLDRVVPTPTPFAVVEATLR
jgi:hypothetical protein